MLDPPPPVHMRPPEPDTPPPLRVDVINGWPLIENVGNKVVAMFLRGPMCSRPKVISIRAVKLKCLYSSINRNHNDNDCINDSHSDNNNIGHNNNNNINYNNNN